MLNRKKERMMDACNKRLTKPNRLYDFTLNAIFTSVMTRHKVLMKFNEG